MARALAVFGMFVVHLGPAANSTTGAGSWVRHLAEGRSSALFATLAGFSLVLLAGRLEPRTGVAGRQAKARIAIRAVILLVTVTVVLSSVVLHGIGAGPTVRWLTPSKPAGRSSRTPTG